MSAEDRVTCKVLVAEAQASGARREKACEMLGISVRTVERWATRPSDSRKGPLTKSKNALSAEERAKVLAIANSAEFANLPPCQIVPRLADQGKYIASESTFYRILNAENMLAHRSRAQPRKHVKPEELLAMSPNEIWSWDITYLRSEISGKFYYLYLPMDIFSRMIVHWEIHEVENAELASEMIDAACVKQGISKYQITLHSDNGGPMKGATMLATLHRLGITPSFSRPKVSDDNPFSEALFKTLKYCPAYPEAGRFDSIEAAKAWVEKFVEWYNNVHLHSGINWVTPSSRHFAKDQAILDQRKAIYETARQMNPGRWTKETRNWSRPNIVELNPGRKTKQIHTTSSDQQAS
ncbi:MAG: IS3 family transposase [Bdellovibrionaceae bacterium]|nr:IS3 family transposase [Pseudobdellovibrionaceae bacterium]